MEIVSAREFRSNQGRILAKAKRGESVVLTSRIGSFKITPITEGDNLTDRISQGLNEAKMMETGTLPRRTIQELLDEL